MYFFFSSMQQTADPDSDRIISYAGDVTFARSTKTSIANIEFALPAPRSREKKKKKSLPVTDDHRPTEWTTHSRGSFRGGCNGTGECTLRWRSL